MQDVTLKLPPAVLDALRSVAREEEVSIGQLIRDAIDRDLRRRTAAKTSVRTDERLVAALRALLADDFAYSESWEDLQRRLGRKGYTLREAGGGLVLCQRDGHRLCKASELGYAYAALAKRFNRPFPGHRHA